MRSFDSELGLGFLLSLGALPIAGCAGEDNGDDTGASSPTSLGTNPTTSDTDATASDDTAGTSATDPTTDGDPTSATNPTATDPTDPTAEGSDTGMTTLTTDPTADTGADTGVELPPGCVDLPIPAGCQQYADKLGECYPRYARYYQGYLPYCACNVSYYAAMYGANCGPAYEDFYACVGALACEVIMGDQPYCEAESMAIDTECEFGDTSGTGANSDGG
jgi:hypothetical protein